MTRYFKTLGLPLLAALVLGAIGASAASASELHSELEETVLTGEQSEGSNDQFTFDAGNVECGSTSYTGSMTGETTTTMSLVPTYSECTATFGLNVAADTNGCEYVVHTGSTENFELVCPPGKVLIFTAPGCEITVFPKTGKVVEKTWLTEKIGAITHLTYHVTKNGVTYEEHNKGFFPTCANKTVLKHNGHLLIKDTVFGRSKAGASTSIWWE